MIVTENSKISKCHLFLKNSCISIKFFFFETSYIESTKKMFHTFSKFPDNASYYTYFLEETPGDPPLPKLHNKNWNANSDVLTNQLTKLLNVI